MVSSPPAARLCVLLLVLLDVVVVHGFMNLHQPCREFKCASAKLKPVPKKDFVFTANGCGTAAMPISTQTDFSDCCNWHDACYSTCGMKKATCEKRLDKCMRAKCEQLSTKEARDECDSTAKLFSLGAQMVACPAYQQAQQEACRCVPQSKVAASIRERIVHFLSENGASEKDQSAQAIYALMDKYKGDEPKLFLRLLVKYPHALHADPTKKKNHFMDDIFKAPDGKHPMDRAEFPRHGGGGVEKEEMKKKRSGKVAVGLEEEDDEEDKGEQFTVDEHIEL